VFEVLDQGPDGKIALIIIGPASRKPPAGSVETKRRRGVFTLFASRSNVQMARSRYAVTQFGIGARRCRAICQALRTWTSIAPPRVEDPAPVDEVGREEAPHLLGRLRLWAVPIVVPVAPCFAFLSRTIDQ